MLRTISFLLALLVPTCEATGQKVCPGAADSFSIVTWGDTQHYVDSPRYSDDVDPVDGITTVDHLRISARWVRDDPQSCNFRLGDRPW